MRLPPAAGLLKRLVAALRGVAAALERRTRRPEEADADALAARFPGAPDHWVRYVAARAPHLARAPREGSDGSGLAPTTREPTRQTAPAPALEVAPDTPRRRGRLTLLTTRDADEHGSPSAPDALSGQRGRLCILPRRATHERRAPDGHDGGGDLDGTSLDGRNGEPGASRQAGTARESTTWSPSPPASRKNAPGRRMPPADGDGTPPTRGEPRAHGPLSPPLQRWVTLRRGEAERPAPTDGRLALRDAMLRAPSSSPLLLGRAPGKREAAPAAISSSSRRRADVDFSHPSAPTSRREAGLRIDREDGPPTWPSLPPRSETAPSAHVPAPRLEQLRREQEDGRWNE